MLPIRFARAVKELAGMIVDVAGEREGKYVIT